MKPFLGYHSPSFSYPGVPDGARVESRAEVVLAVGAPGVGGGRGVPGRRDGWAPPAFP